MTNNTRQHTPGPWAWVYADANHERPIALERDDGPDVLTASEDTIGPRAYVSEADAHLIAAAPDLLAACEELLVEVASMNAMRGYRVMPTVVEKIRAAVAKAKGAPTC
jgi:hypothetical protein